VIGSLDREICCRAYREPLFAACPKVLCGVYPERSEGAQDDKRRVQRDSKWRESAQNGTAEQFLNNRLDVRNSARCFQPGSIGVVVLHNTIIHKEILGGRVKQRSEADSCGWGGSRGRPATGRARDTIGFRLPSGIRMRTIPLTMLNQGKLEELLRPFGIGLSDRQRMQLQTYLELLLRWNSKINLTAIRQAEDCVTRHFGESLYLAQRAQLEGSLLDIGSGAGFPGLALKILFPDLGVTLLEPTAKKRAFLKEVTRACEFRDVEVCGLRLEEFVGEATYPLFDSASSRAVGHFDKLIPFAVRCLRPGGSLYLWLTGSQGRQLGALADRLRWDSPLPIPLTREGEIWHGTWAGSASVAE
jgi:16S rRNA (guanine527-N7)-methyltransferase